jgi:hypothetical protein
MLSMTRKFKTVDYEKSLKQTATIEECLPPDHLARFVVAIIALLGLSYGAVSLTLEALGAYMCKTSVYEVVKAAAERVPGLRRDQVFEGIRTPALGSDVTSVKCNGEWVHIGLSVDDTNGLVLTVDGLGGEDAETLQSWIEPIAAAVEAEVLVARA